MDLQKLKDMMSTADVRYLNEVCREVIFDEWTEGLDVIIKHPSFNPAYDMGGWSCISLSMQYDNLEYFRKLLAHPKVHVEKCKKVLLQEAVYYGYERCTKFLLMLFLRDYKFEPEYLTSACLDHNLNEDVVRILVNDGRFPITEGAIRTAQESNNPVIINLLN